MWRLSCTSGFAETLLTGPSNTFNTTYGAGGREHIASRLYFNQFGGGNSKGTISESTHSVNTLESEQSLFPGAANYVYVRVQQCFVLSDTGIPEYKYVSITSNTNVLATEYDGAYSASDQYAQTFTNIHALRFGMKNASFQDNTNMLFLLDNVYMGRSGIFDVSSNEFYTNAYATTPLAIACFAAAPLTNGAFAMWLDDGTTQHEATNYALLEGGKLMGTWSNLSPAAYTLVVSNDGYSGTLRSATPVNIFAFPFSGTSAVTNASESSVRFYLSYGSVSNVTIRNVADDTVIFEDTNVVYSPVTTNASWTSLARNTSYTCEIVFAKIAGGTTTVTNTFTTPDARFVLRALSATVVALDADISGITNVCLINGVTSALIAGWTNTDGSATNISLANSGLFSGIEYTYKIAFTLSSGVTITNADTYSARTFTASAAALSLLAGTNNVNAYLLPYATTSLTNLAVTLNGTNDTNIIVREDVSNAWVRTSLSPNTLYATVLTGRGYSGSVVSQAVSFTTLSPIVSNLALTPAPLEGKVSLSYEQAAASAYLIYRSTNDAETFTLLTNTTAATYDDTNVENGRNYVYKVLTMNSANESNATVVSNANFITYFVNEFQINSRSTSCVITGGQANVYLFDNITFDASATTVEVTVTALSGNVVYRTVGPITEYGVSNWDLKGTSGRRRVQSGVYILRITPDVGNATQTILIIAN